MKLEWKIGVSRKSKNQPESLGSESLVHEVGEYKPAENGLMSL